MFLINTCVYAITPVGVLGESRATNPKSAENFCFGVGFVLLLPPLLLQLQIILKGIPIIFSLFIGYFILYSYLFYTFFIL